MTQIKRILCPVDFSETSEKAFRVADGLAQRLQAELVLLHAFDIPATIDIPGQEHPADTELPARLNAIRSSSLDVALDRVLHAGPPGDVICWLAQERGCDLIVMGTHGRTGVVRLLLGSVAEHVLRHARCPVLTVRKRPENEPLLKEPKVLPLPAPRLM